jgi:hypothetical protein
MGVAKYEAHETEKKPTQMAAPLTEVTLSIRWCEQDILHEHALMQPTTVSKLSPSCGLAVFGFYGFSRGTEVRGSSGENYLVWHPRGVFYAST